MVTSIYTNSTHEVTTTAAIIFEGNLIAEPSVVARNRGPETVFLGGPDVTSDTSINGGLPLYPGEKVTLSTPSNVNADLYAVTAQGSSFVSWVTNPA